MHTHFVYAGDPGDTKISSPYTITQNLYKHLTAQGHKIHYYDWCHTGPLAPVGPKDIILAHPNYPTNTPTQRLFQEPTPNKYLIFPIHHGDPSINAPFTPLVHQAKHVFGIMGQYWFDTLNDNTLPGWKPKITRLDMAINPNHYPASRQKFHPPGQRTFAHIGCDRPEKGTHILHDIFQGTQHQLHIYGNFNDSPLLRLPNVKYHGYVQTTPEFGLELCNKTDVFLNTSTSDANPTTLLEATCWGLPVACTPQSGYWPDQPFWGLNPNDLHGIHNLLKYIQEATNQTLWNQLEKQRQKINQSHTWNQFLTTITNKIATTKE